MAVTDAGLGEAQRDGRKGSGADGNLEINKLADSDRVMKGTKTKHPRTPVVEKREPDGAERRGNK
jgi:hypothetical protein